MIDSTREKVLSNFRSAGFIFDEGFSETGKFYKEGIEVEFLSFQMGSGPGVVEIPFTGVLAEKLDNLDILRPIVISARGHRITIPSSQMTLFVLASRRATRKSLDVQGTAQGWRLIP